MSNGLHERKIALIGGAGFIGHHLGLYLACQGANVEVIDNLSSNNLGEITSSNVSTPNAELYLKMIRQRLDLLQQSGIRLHAQDARDYSGLKALLNELKPDVIVQLAGVSNAARSNEDPQSAFDHSLRTLVNVLDFARDRVERFVFLSSSMVYGNLLTSEFEEDHPLNPIGIYGALKVAGEKMVHAYHQVFHMPYTIIRASAVYGPRCVSRRVGQIFIENALNGERLRIDGDGQQEKLDFTYVEDLIEGIGQAISNPAARNQIFNVTNGHAHSIGGLAGILKEEFPNLEIDYVERNSLMPVRGTLSIAKARRLIGYSPKNPIRIGFLKYIDWYRSFWKERDACSLVQKR